MPYRKIPLVNESIYHVYNRGVEKRNIFTAKSDYERFFRSLQYYSFSGNKLRFARFNINDILTLNTKRIEILSYCLMPNHFHLLVRQVSDKGVSSCIGQLSNSYTKYFNTKYKRVGPLFQGSFKAVLIENTEQLIHVSRYIHLNPYVSEMLNKEDMYAFSSLHEYLGGQGPCKKETVMQLFDTSEEYKKFVFDNLDYGKSLEFIKHQVIDWEE